MKAQAPEANAGDGETLAEALQRIPDLAEALHAAPPKLKRQVFEAFCLEVRFDKAERRIEIYATVSEAVAKAFENTKDLQKEVPCVTTNDIAGARFVSPSDAPGIVERRRWPVKKAA